MTEISNEWTLMVYMAGDNSLSTDLVYALEELKQVARNGNSKLDIYAYFDGLSPDVPTLYCDFNDPCDGGDNSELDLCQPSFYQSWKVKDKLIKVDEQYNENSARITNVINFVHWCVNRKKPKPEEIARRNYAFIFSGHSFGFLNWGLFKDEKANYYMTHRKLRYMFERITAAKNELVATADVQEEAHRVRTGNMWSRRKRKERTTPILGKKLGFLGFDSCVMSTLEIASQFRRFAETMVASEGSIPTAGWNYATILGTSINELTKPETTPQQMSIDFVDRFIKQQRKFALADISVDISAWDLSKLEALESRFGKFVNALLRTIDKGGKGMRRQIQRAITYAHARCQTYMFEQHIDLADFCGELISELNFIKEDVGQADYRRVIKLRDDAKKLIESIGQCVLLTGFSGGDFQFSKGVSLFFPWSYTSYLSAREDYEELSFISDTYGGRRWNEFLHKFLGDLTFRRPDKISKPDAAGVFKGEVVSFQSYSFKDRDDLDSGHLWEGHYDDRLVGGGGGDAGKQPPNGTRQPPNGTRQPPNDPRRMDEMSVFLNRFLRLKNFRFEWNRAGFRSARVKFCTPMSTEDQESPQTPYWVKIPPARRIGRKFVQLRAMTDSLPDEFASEKPVYELILSSIYTLATSELAEDVADILSDGFEKFDNDRLRLFASFEHVTKLADGVLQESQKTTGVLTAFENLRNSLFVPKRK